MRIHVLILAALLTGCARSEPANPAAGDDEALSGELTNAAAQEEEQAAPGTWEPAAEGAAQSVVFRGSDGRSLFSIRCDERGGLVVQRPGLVSRGNLALMQLRTGDTVRRLAVNTGSGTEPQVQATVPYNDQLISALMSFDEPLEVRYEGLQTVVLPPSPVVIDLVRTCQQAAGATAPAAAAGGAADANAVQPQGGTQSQQTPAQQQQQQQNQQ